MNKDTIDSLYELIRHWKLARREIARLYNVPSRMVDCDALSDADDTLADSASAVMMTLFPPLKCELCELNVKIVPVEKSALHKLYAFGFLDFLVEVKVIDSLSSDVEDEDEEVAFAGADSFSSPWDGDSDEAELWCERHIHFHLKNVPNRIFFWGSVEGSFIYEKPREVEINSTDFGHEAAIVLFRLCQEIEQSCR